ncbi:MAG: hypothetical protein CBARDMAM_0994 [uncultured Caballeronia sp.]|nr:MAG: hypothetical protein CBARDMAM_0994 [uncultured Caballeronia sp.]
MTTKAETPKKSRGRRPAVSTTEKIAETERLLTSLREQARREERENLDKNRKAISDLFESERLDTIDVEVWRNVVPQLKALVGLAASSESEPPVARRQRRAGSGAAGRANRIAVSTNPRPRTDGRDSHESQKPYAARVVHNDVYCGQLGKAGGGGACGKCGGSEPVASGDPMTAPGRKASGVSYSPCDRARFPFLDTASAGDSGAGAKAR